MSEGQSDLLSATRDDAPGGTLVALPLFDDHEPLVEAKAEESAPIEQQVEREEPPASQVKATQPVKPAATPPFKSRLKSTPNRLSRRAHWCRLISRFRMPDRWRQPFAGRTSLVCRGPYWRHHCAKPARPRFLAMVETPLPGDRAAGVALRAGYFQVGGLKAPIGKLDFASPSGLTPPFSAQCTGSPGCATCLPVRRVGNAPIPRAGYSVPGSSRIPRPAKGQPGMWSSQVFAF